jgi:hypothetical protein
VSFSIRMCVSHELTIGIRSFWSAYYNRQLEELKCNASLSTQVTFDLQSMVVQAVLIIPSKLAAEAGDQQGCMLWPCPQVYHKYYLTRPALSTSLTIVHSKVKRIRFRAGNLLCDEKKNTK